MSVDGFIAGPNDVADWMFDYSGSCNTLRIALSNQPSAVSSAC
jgi:hypothetical protein